MGQHPEPVVWKDGGQRFRMLERLTDEQCLFLDANVGISRRTLRHVHVMFNERFDTKLNWQDFYRLRKEAIQDGRARTTYLKHYYKNENSSERELRLQRPVLKSRIIGGCQYIAPGARAACGAETPGRYCEAHAHAAFGKDNAVVNRISGLDQSLGKYG